jgi:hypothetical protein
VFIRTIEQCSSSRPQTVYKAQFETQAESWRPFGPGTVVPPTSRSGLVIGENPSLQALTSEE